MIVTVLGSGTLLPNDRRRSPAHLVEGAAFRLLLDCGAGTVHGFDRHHVPWRTLTHVALSHFHTDHTGDVAALLFALQYGLRPPREEPLTVLGPPGLRAFLDALAAAHGAFVTRPSFPLEVVELPRAGSWSDPGGGFTLRTHPTPHTEASLAYRVEHADGDVGYTGDTGPSADLGEFFAGVALLVAECSVEDAGAMPIHLSPASLAALATRAGPGLLAVTHLYPPLRHHRIPRLLRDAGYAGNVAVAADGMAFEVAAGSVALRGP